MKKRNIMIICFFVIYVGLFVSYFIFLLFSHFGYTNMPFCQYFWQFIISTMLGITVISSMLFLSKKKNRVVINLIIISFAVVLCLFLWNMEDKIITFSTHEKSCKYSGVCEVGGDYFEIDEYVIYINKGQMAYTKKIKDRWMGFGDTLYGPGLIFPNDYVIMYEIEEKLLIIGKNSEDIDISYENKSFEKNNNGILYMLIPYSKNITLNINGEIIEFKYCN